jgi:hypothetical protein
VINPLEDDQPPEDKQNDSDLYDRMLGNLFSQIALAEGVPSCVANVTCKAGGTVIQDGMPVGHDNDLIALGLLTTGMMAVRPLDGGIVEALGQMGDEDAVDPDWKIVSDRDAPHAWLHCYSFTRKQTERLIETLNDLLAAPVG